MRISDWSSDVCSSDLTVTAWLSSAPHDVPLHQRSALAPGRSIAGPAIIIDALSTTVVEPGWSATVEQEGTLRLTNSPFPSGEGLGWGLETLSKADGPPPPAPPPELGRPSVRERGWQ